MTVGERVKRIRQYLEWTQDRLAQESGLSKSFISEIENDKANMSGENLLRIANTLNTSLDYLMKGEPEPDSKQDRAVEIPPALSAMAEEQGLSYRSTVSLLKTQDAWLAKRSSKEKKTMSKEDWLAVYMVLKKHLDGE
jgi:transcriptional regulator with XRE-family HTH domain